MEFETPKKLIQNFINPTIEKLIKNLPENNYYTFANRRMYAKFRRLGYFVPECEKLYKRLVFDQLCHFDAYDFNSFNIENPSIEEEQKIE